MFLGKEREERERERKKMKSQRRKKSYSLSNSSRQDPCWCAGRSGAHGQGTAGCTGHRSPCDSELPNVEHLTLSREQQALPRHHCISQEGCLPTRPLQAHFRLNIAPPLPGYVSPGKWAKQASSRAAILNHSER